MIEINATLVVQMINFFVLLFILKQILFKPLVNNIQDRRNYISDTEKKVKEGLTRLEAAEKEYQLQLDTARQKSQEVISSNMAKAEEEKQKIVNAATEETRKVFAEFKAELEAETAKTRAQLEPEIDVLAQQITNKILAANPTGDKLLV